MYPLIHRRCWLDARWVQGRLHRGIAALSVYILVIEIHALIAGMNR